MFESRRVWNCSLILAIGSLGCAHLMETRTIEKFSTNLQKQDMDGLKAHSSEEFSGRALRTADAIDDLEILRIPNGKVSVVEVEELSKTHKRVTVEIGEAKKEVFYELTKNTTGKWVVDDIYLKQKKQGVEAYKAVSEQMDLLLTVREFLDACDNGEREEVLAGTTPQLRGALEKLPPAYLARLTEAITRGRSGAKTQKPLAQLSDNTAVVKFPRKTGDTLLTLQLRKGRWQVDDVMVDSKNAVERLPSVYREALAVEQCLKFLAAYERCDRKTLAEACSADFYEGSLAVGNLKEVQLPSPLLTDHELKSSMTGVRADFTLRNDREIVQLTLHRQKDNELEETPRFQVSSVTIFDVATQQERRLGAMFTAKAMGQFYLEALSQRDVSKLRHSSTKDFSTRVWQKLNETTITTAPLEPFDGPPATVGQLHFDGSLVRMTAMAGEHPVELMLREEAGRFLVDDIRWELPGRPSTAKATLELMIPVRNFANGIAVGREPDRQEAALALLQETSSRDFNRLVWTQTEFVPNSGWSADTFLNAPLKSLTQSDGQVIVQLGDQQFGAVVTMIKEQERYAIDEVLLVTGPEPENRLTMKQQLRTQLAHGKAQPPEGLQAADRIQRVGRSEIEGERTASRVIQTIHIEKSPRVKPSPVPAELDEPDDAMPIEDWSDFDAVQTEPDAE